MKKYQQTIATGIVVLIGLLFAVFWEGDPDLGKALKERRSGQVSTETKSAPKSKTKVEEKEEKGLKKAANKKVEKKKQILVKGPKGQEDITATLRRIERGEKFPHRNDGGVFRNREKRLPLEKRNYYREFVHPTKGRRGPGAQRIVIGDKKEIYYTPDHYETFQRVKNEN